MWTKKSFATSLTAELKIELFMALFSKFGLGIEKNKNPSFLERTFDPARCGRKVCEGGARYVDDIHVYIDVLLVLV